MAEAIDQATVPLFPTKDTALRLRSFSGDVYNINESSNIYKFVDALVGDAGVGTLKKQLLINRLAQSLDTTYFTDLDNVFGNLLRLARLTSETYLYDATSDLLTTDQWNEIKIKDSWYRARIKNTFKAIALGGSPDGLRLMVKAAIGTDCELYESWRFQDYAESIYGNSYVPESNFINNPSFENNVVGWADPTVTAGAGATITRDTVLVAARQVGTATLKWNTGAIVGGLPAITSKLGSDSSALVSKTFDGGKAHNFSMYVYRPNTTANSSVKLRVAFHDLSTGLEFVSPVESGNFTLASNAKTRINVNFTTPTTRRCRITVSLVVNSGTPANQEYYLDGLLLTEGSSTPAYFDGATSGFRWEGTAGNSSTVKTRSLDYLSRSNFPMRNEVIIYPHKQNLSVLEKVQLKNMTKRLAPVDSVITISETGLPVNNVVNLSGVSASSTFFQIGSMVTGKPGSTMTADEEPNSSYRWLTSGVEKEAPTGAFSEPQEFSQYYVYNDNEDNSIIDSIAYSSQNASSGLVKDEDDYKIVKETIKGWGQWTWYDKADSPDNYPGGRDGKTPKSAPALTKTGQKYKFPYASQNAFVEAMKKKILALGGQSRQMLNDGTGIFAYKVKPGQTTHTQFRLPNSYVETVVNSWPAYKSVANKEPTKISTITTGWISRNPGDGE